MLANVRKKAILELLREEGAVTTLSLSERFGVSIETVRRDLLMMEREELLCRVHGGAVLPGRMHSYGDLPYRLEENREKKEALCLRAMEQIREGDILALGGGSTALYFATLLTEHFHHLTVVTHYMDIFLLLKEKEDFQVILTGGNYHRPENTFYGPLTLEMLASMHVDKSFVFPSAVSLEAGICDYIVELIPVQKALCQAGATCYILADSSKFEARALYPIAPMRKDFIYITDPALSEELRTLYKENGRRVLY